MKVFLDTNIFLEYFQERQQCRSVKKIFDAIEDKKLDAVISIGCIYTLDYLIRVGLKRLNIHRPEQTRKLREALNTILEFATVVGTSHDNIVNAINDETFDDIEDSFQYQCALQNKCDVLLTINLRDYPAADITPIIILSPDDFCKAYLQ